MPLPADATEFVDAPTNECDALGWFAFKLVLLGDHCVKSSSTISVSCDFVCVSVCLFV